MVMSTKKVKKPAPTVSFTNRELYLTCMKNRMTRTALMTAIPMATIGLKTPMSTKAMPVVRPVRHKSASRISPYIFGPTMWCSVWTSSSVGCDDTVCLLKRMIEFLVQRVTTDQVEQWEQEYPNNIDEVPIQPKVVDDRRMSAGISAF